MAASIFDGPLFSYGNMGALPASLVGTPGVVVDPNSDAGPDAVFQGLGILDCRYWFPKDKIQGFPGNAVAHLMTPRLRSIGQIPATTAANNIAAAQNVTNGTAMTLAAASTGITPNVPIVPFSGVLNAATVVSVMALDFGFAFGTVVSGSTTVVVSSSSLFAAGMPLVIAGVGNAAGTTALLTTVASVTDSTHIVLTDAPAASLDPAPIGTGNLWGPVETSRGGYPTPTAAFPFLAGGPGLYLDTRQAVTRGVRIVGPGGGSGGNFLVSGYDIFGSAMSELITVAAGSNTVYSLKAFKYIASVVPQFTDAQNYTVGTSDVFGFAFRSTTWELTDVKWAGATMVSSQGWVTADQTSPATTTTDDVRGTIQTSATGGGTGIGASASNGTVVSLAMSGRRLEMAQFISAHDSLAAFPANPVSLYGVTQA